MIYPKSIADIAKGIVGPVYCYGQTVFYRKVGMPVILTGIWITEKLDREI